jgi:ABC-type Fe3+ transport system permease subunit
MSAIRNSPSTDQAVTRPVRIASACFYLAAVVALTGVLGVVLGSVPDIQDRLGVDPDAYWNDRLQASLILAALGLSFGVIVNLVGAYLSHARDPGRRAAGRLILIVTVLPHLASIISLLALTPEDWSHTITHILAVALIAAGLTALRGQPERA